MGDQHRRTVLLIDDDPDILNLMEYAFPAGEFQLLTTTSPEEGLQLLARQPVDCAVIDIHFARTPECLGFLAALRNLDRNRQVRVFATSVMTNREIVRQVLERGADRFISKPFYPAEVIEAVRAATVAPDPGAAGD